MSAPVFDTRLVGQTEKALNALLAGFLTGTPLSEPAWVALTLTVTGTERRTPDALAAHVAGILQVPEARAGEILDGLAEQNYLHTTAQGHVEPTAHGHAEWTRIRSDIAAFTPTLWGDVPEADLATAARVLHTVHTRALARLGAA